MTQGLTRFLTPEERGRLSRMVLQSRYVVEGALAGRHRSHAKGSSTEFADHRAYIPGDDPRKIDWKVLGRTDRYYIRRYEDETILRVYLVVDRSASMGYTSGGPTKYHVCCRLAAALGYVVVGARDAAGFYLYADRIDAMIPPRNTLVHLNNAMKVLGESAPASTTNTARTLHQIAASIQRRALIVLMSDLFDEPEDVFKALAHFRKHNHDVILLHVLDPMELDFTYRRAARFEDLETGEVITADPRALAPSYRKAMREFLELYRGRCAEMKIDYRLVNTAEPVEAFAKAYLDERRKWSG